MTALVDCGAQYSGFDLNFLHKTPGVALSTTSMIMEGVDGRRERVSAFTPKTFELGSYYLEPMELIAAEAPVFSKAGFDALIGYDVLASHLAIIDLGNNTLWMK